MEPGLLEEEGRTQEAAHAAPDEGAPAAYAWPVVDAAAGVGECDALYERVKALLETLEAERAARLEAEDRCRRLEQECGSLREELSALRRMRERWEKPAELIFRVLVRAVETEVELERRLEEEVNARLRRLTEDGILRALVGEEFFRHLVAGGPAGPEKWEEWVAAIVRRVVHECGLKVVRVEGV